MSHEYEHRMLECRATLRDDGSPPTFALSFGSDPEVKGENAGIELPDETDLSGIQESMAKNMKTLVAAFTRCIEGRGDKTGVAGLKFAIYRAKAGAGDGTS